MTTSKHINDAKNTIQNVSDSDYSLKETLKNIIDALEEMQTELESIKRNQS